MLCLQTHPDNQVTSHNRMILVDWLIDVSMHCDLKFDTLHLALSYFHRFLIHPGKLCIQDLQLVGVAAVKLADQFN